MSSPYCQGSYASGQCNQPNPSNTPGNGINDFINDFNTTGANVNIVNNNSGCNGLNNNYIYYGCQHFLAVTAGQTITCNMRSGIIFDQGFAIFIDWNQDNTFQNPAEMVAFTGNAPTANTWTVLTFVIPPTQASGTYRMRVRCLYAQGGNNCTPCGQHSHGETEDYNLYVGNSLPPSIITATASISNSLVCAGQQVSLNVAYSGTAVPSFTWNGPQSYSTTLQNPVITPTGQAQSGIYTATVSNGACPVTVSVQLQVVNYPQFTLTPSTPTICQGGAFFAQTQFSFGVSTALFSFNWGPTTGAGQIFSPLGSATNITPLPLSVSQSVATQIYSVTVSPTVHACPVQKTLTVTIYNPFTPVLSLPQPVCNTFAQQQLSATPGGGTWSANPGVSAGGLLTPSLAAIGTNTVMYAVKVGSCQVSNTGTFSVSKFHPATLTSSLSTVCVQDPVYNLMNLVQDTVTGKWAGINVSQDRYFSPQGLPTGNYAFTYSTWSTPVASVCPTSTVFSLYLFNPPTPTIANILPVCNNGGTVQLAANPAGGVWTGNGISVSGIQTPSLSSIGTNNVMYTAGLGTCVASSSRTFHVSNFNTADLSGTMPHQCASSPPFNLMSIVQNSAGVWSGINVSNNIFSTTGLPTNNYTLTYNTVSNPDPALCPDSQTLAVFVLNPQAPSIVQAGPFCSRDGTFQLSASPAGNWVPSPYLTQTGIFTASLAPVGLSSVQYVVGTSTCFAKQSRFISVEAFVPAVLSTNRLPDLCNTSSPISLVPIGMSGSGSWQGPGLQGASFNPALSGAGQFILTHTTASYPSGLCPDASTLSVHVYSLEAPFVANAGPYCSTSAPVQLTVSPAGGVFEGNNNTAVNSAGLFLPSGAQVGANVITYSISSGPCVAYTQATINVERFIPATLNRSELVFCQNSKPFNLNSLAIHTGGRWQGPAVGSEGMFDPSKATPGLHKVVYSTHPAGDPLLCPDTRTLNVKVDAIPAILVSTSETSGCAPHEVLFNIPNTNAGTAEWNFGDGSENRSGLSLTHVYASSGSYSVTLNYSVGACFTRTTLSSPIKILEAPKADFSFSRPELSISEPSVSLVNRSTVPGRNTYTWTVQGQAPRFEVNPDIEFPAVGTYKVDLRARSIDGCVSEISRTIEVKNDFSVYIPNSFSPNFDGINDKFMPVFSPYGLDAKSFELEIFDRWGHEIYRTTDLSKGWDGTLHNKGDARLKEGVYIYRVRFRDINGQSFQRTGNFTLLGGN